MLFFFFLTTEAIIHNDKFNIILRKQNCDATAGKFLLTSSPALPFYPVHLSKCNGHVHLSKKQNKFFSRNMKRLKEGIFN